MEKRTCSECGDVLMGRADKKFCSDNCRNAYNNRMSGDSNNAMRRIILVLKKNRRILEELYKSEKKKINKKTLLEKGYDYNKLTHLYVNKKGNTYRFCFDYGFVEYEDGWLFLVTDTVNNENPELS